MKNIDSFDDVCAIQKHLKEQGIEPGTQTDETTARHTLSNPDGNQILIDQHR